MRQTKESNKRAPGRVVIYILVHLVSSCTLTFSNVLLVLALNLIVHKSSYCKCSLAWCQARPFFYLWSEHIPSKWENTRSNMQVLTKIKNPTIILMFVIIAVVLTVLPPYRLIVMCYNSCCIDCAPSLQTNFYVCYNGRCIHHAPSLQTNSYVCYNSCCIDCAPSLQTNSYVCYNSCCIDCAPSLQTNCYMCYNSHCIHHAPSLQIIVMCVIIAVVFTVLPPYRPASVISSLNWAVE